MAILRGFPPSNTISPSVRITEKDLSFVAPQQSFHRAGLIGFASKGPINVPTMVSSQRQLTTMFGYPHPESGDPYLIYAADQYLLIANELYVVRVADEDAVSDEAALTAEIDVPSAGGQIQVLSNTTFSDTSDTSALGYNFVTDSFFRWKLNGILHSKTLVVLTGVYTAAQLAEDLNLQLVGDIDGIEFITHTNDTKIGVQTTFSFGPDAELEFVSVQDAIYGGPVGVTNPLGLGISMTQASITGSLDRYPQTYQTAGEYDFAGLTDLNLQVVVDGTDNVLIDNVVQVIDLALLEGIESTTTEVVDEINAQIALLPGGFEAFVDGDNVGLRTLHHGRDARMLVKPDSTADALLGLANVTVTGASPVGTSGDGSTYNYGRVNGDANSTGAITFTVTADSPGIDGNATQVVIANNVREDNFSIQVYNGGAQVESWGGLVKDENSRFYVETFMALVSDWIRVSDNTSNAASPLDGTYTLVGGSDGIPSDPDDQDALIVGNQLAYTGMYALSEPEQIDIDLIAVPGHASTTVVTAMLDLCQNVRMDCMAIVDAPFGLTVNEIVDWQNGSHPLNTTRFDSDFGALYWPWVKIRDNYNRVDIWAPPSGSVMATIARSDGLSAPWFAPAGVNRGIVPNITDVFSRPTLEERDLMYGYRNAINPIVQFVDFQGFVIWGQKTLQRTPTALDRVNVRRLMFVIEKRIRVASRQLLFDPHDEILRAKFVRIATAILTEIQVGRGVDDFKVICDTTLNTPDVIDRNEMRARIGVIPIRAAEFIFIEFSIHRTGSDFSESSTTF